MSTISPNRLRKIKEQLNNGKSHYVDTTWMDDELMIDLLMDGCFTCLLTFSGKILENLPHSIYNPKQDKAAVGGTSTYTELLK